MAHHNTELPLHLSMSNSEHAIMTSDEEDEKIEHHIPTQAHGNQRPGMLRRASLQGAVSNNSMDSGVGLGYQDADDYGGEQEDFEPWHHPIGLWITDQVQKRTSQFVSFLKSFAGWHYIYIVSTALLLSFILYPMKNMSYTDALFNAVSMATCTGLNATPVDKLALYQSIIIYLVVSFSQPLFIHSSLIWFRLRLYEKKFDNINERARQQSKLRRAATRSASYARANTNRRHSTVTGRPANLRPVSSVSLGVTASAVQPDHRGQLEHAMTVQPHDDALSATSGSSNGGFFAAAPHPGAGTSVSAEADTGPSVGGGVAFGNLPKPADHDDAHERTRNVYRSLNMLQNKSYIVEDDNDEDDEGPALIIKSPQAIEADAARGIESAVFTKDHNLTNNNTGGLTFQTARPPKAPTSTGEGASTGIFNRHDTSASGLSQRSRISSRRRRQSMSANYLSWQPTVGGNSTFVNLTQEQKDELGGVEYRALHVLLYFIYAYHFGMILIAGIIMAAWCVSRSYYAEIIRSEGSSPAWFGFFMGMSAFNNLGLSLSPNSFADFQTTAFLPLFGAFFILFGDMLLPVGLRFCLWLTFRLTPRYGVLHESLGFLLDHPRRCFSLLFPRNATWWLLFIVVLLASTDFILFIILDVNASELASIPTNYRIMSGFFQGLSVRKCGFSILTMTDLHPAILVLYVVMMYISVLPVAISMRSTNVYEEQSLGVYYYAEEHGQLAAGGGEQSALSKHLQRQLAHDLWYLSLGLILVAICEGGPLQRGEISLFDVLFECVSGYGNSGASVGWPGTTVSLSGNFNTVGKLVMMGLMIRGRHRGLPYPVERAIILKDDDLKSRDQVQQNVVRDAQTLQMPRANPDPENPWLTRIGTAASKIKREATTRLEKAKTVDARLLRRQTIHESHPSVPVLAQARSDLSSNSSDGKTSDNTNSSSPSRIKSKMKRAYSLG